MSSINEEISSPKESSSSEQSFNQQQQQQQQPLRLLVRMNSSSSSTKVVVPASSLSTSSANNKRHNLGFRLRHLIFPPFRPNNDIRSTKDVEAGENKNSLNQKASFKASSSELDSDSQHQTFNKRKRTRHQEQQTDNLLLRSTPSGSKDSTAYLIECPICLLEQPLSSYPELSTCHHRACDSCMFQYLRVEIYESRVNITCPQCSEQIHPNDIKKILRNSNLVEKYESFMLRRILITDPDARWCPAPDCSYCVIASGCASCPKLRCGRSGCGTFFCYHCKQEWHPNQTCDEAKQTRSRKGTSKSVVTFGNGNGKKNNDYSRPSTSIDSSLFKRDDLKPCPCCKVLIIKMADGSCNHMTCSVCGTEFCWLCMQKISDLHYLSPSGCTFWGKKPWSRKKKIMWQLGMLVGAPIGIALIAGIAVPAIIIGIPVWVGRKMYARFERNHLSRPKSNLLVTAGVLTAIFVSPILAAVAVGIGVPILLAYVYGVVPFSLCRSGGCGITTSSSGVKIDLDEDDATTSVPVDGVSLDTALSGNRVIGNPSIGEVSLGLSTSLSIGSNNHLDRVVLDIQPDRENGSIQGCAGSISSALLVNGQTQTEGINSNKLETQADVNKRYSFSSQNADATSASLSFSENRSLKTNLSTEEGSLKVHTGSICCGVVSPVEVHFVIKDQDSQKDAKIGSDSISTESTTINLFNRFESRSLEYLSCNYCNICHKSHKPCCPNFQHPKNSKLELTPPTKSNRTYEKEIKKQKEDERMDIKNNNFTYDKEIFRKHFQDDTIDKHQHSVLNMSNATGKASSQIIYPNIYNDSINRDKSSLSHSLSFIEMRKKTNNSFPNEIIENDH